MIEATIKGILTDAPYHREEDGKHLTFATIKFADERKTIHLCNIRARSEETRETLIGMYAGEQVAVSGLLAASVWKPKGSKTPAPVFAIEAEQVRDVKRETMYLLSDTQRNAPGKEVSKFTTKRPTATTSTSKAPSGTSKGQPAAIHKAPAAGSVVTVGTNCPSEEGSNIDWNEWPEDAPW